jgi:hypothetical protein
MVVDNDSHEINHRQIPGLQQSLISGHFGQACKRQNELPTDDVLLQVKMEVLEGHLSYFKQLFKRYNVENVFAVYLLHRHFDVPDGCSLLGRTISDGYLYWTRKVANNTLNCGKVCGRKFVFDKEGWFPCEFHEGSAPDLSKVDPGFFTEFTTYLVECHLTSTFGLEYIIPELRIIDMLEIDLPNYGLILVETASVPFNDPTVPTRWDWSDPIHTRVLKCIPFPTGHKKVNVDQQEPFRSDNEVINAFAKKYLKAY